MQRPVMNPLFTDDVAPVERQRFVRTRVVLRMGWRCVKILLRDPFRPEGKLRIEDGTPLQRLVRGVGYRLAFAPVLLVLFVVALVFAGTRPMPKLVAELDPVSVGVYYDPVEFLSSDGTRVQAWLVPVIDAKRVLEHGSNLLQAKYPAVVLAHDFGASRQQMLPLVKPLHEAGFVVLVVALRGSGTDSAVGQTFGLNEALDLTAAIDLLRKRTFVDPARIGVVGVGTGANAALICADHDVRLSAVVLHEPVKTSTDAIRKWVGPRQSWLAWVDPLCLWTFEIAYGLDAEDIEPVRYAQTERRLPVLRTGASAAHLFHKTWMRDVESFLHQHLDPARDGLSLPHAAAGVGER